MGILSFQSLKYPGANRSKRIVPRTKGKVKVELHYKNKNAKEYRDHKCLTIGSLQSSVMHLVVTASRESSTGSLINQGLKIKFLIKKGISMVVMKKPSAFSKGKSASLPLEGKELPKVSMNSHSVSSFLTKNYQPLSSTSTIKERISKSNIQSQSILRM